MNEENSERAMNTGITKSILITTLITCTIALVLPNIASTQEKAMSVMEQGKSLTFDRKKGNCLACHRIADAASPGNIGPALVAMKARYPQKSELRKRIWDMTEFKPEVTMPPFGKHRILSEDEIDKITEYIWSL